MIDQIELTFDELKEKEIRKETLNLLLEDLKYKYRTTNEGGFYKAGIWKCVELVQLHIYLIDKDGG